VPLSFSSFWALIVNLKFDASELEDATAASPSRYHHTGPRNSLSSVSSLDVDLGEPEELALIPEVDPDVEKAHAMASTPSPSEIFAVPKTKHCNSIIRYEPYFKNYIKALIKCIQFLEISYIYIIFKTIKNFSYIQTIS